MKRKFLSTALLGLLLLAPAATTVSCSDYDDEINNLQSQIDDLNTLKATKTELETQISTLKSELEAKDGELQTAIDALKAKDSEQQTQIDSKADASTVEALRAEVTSLKASVAALETRIATAESALTSLNTLVANLENNKVDKTTYEEEVTNIYTAIAAVDAKVAANLTSIESLQKGLEDEALARQAVANDLQEQIEALDKIEALYDDNTKISEIKNLIENLTERVGNNEGSIDDIKNQLTTLSSKIDELSAEINVLNVLVKDSLRSLVFRPDAYYWGVEATRLFYLENDTFKLDATAWNTKERAYDETGISLSEAAERTVHNLYPSDGNFTKVLDFVACYHMNPSNADIEGAKVSVLSDDKTAIERAAACGLSVKDWSTDAGVLKVNLVASNPDKVKSVANDQQITVFATQVNIQKGGANGKDTTITSDYATLYKESIKNFRLAHTAGSSVPFLGVKNTHCGACALTNQNNHLMATVYEAKTFAPQDYCLYNGTLDLTTLVETHYTTVSGTTHAKMTADDLKAAGLEYQFELTGLYLGGNETSESAHAAISGTTFRPQMPEYDENNVGKQQAYGATQDRQEIGRTPLVRVKLVDTETGKVLDYGYIRIKITEKVENPDEPVVEPEVVEYTGAGWTYNYECTPTGWSYSTKWIQTEYDLYNKVGMTREEFKDNYTAVATEDDATVLRQYEKSGTKYVERSASEYVGTVLHIGDTSTEDGTLTSVLRWNVTGQDMLKYFVTERATEKTATIKYESASDKYPDIYVTFKTGTPITINQPHGVVALDSKKNANYWYEWNNKSDDGLDEVHTNTITPEDNSTGNAYALDNRFSDLFVGNNITAAGFIPQANITDYTSGKEYASSKLTIDLRFANSNNGKKYKGYGSSRNVITYTMYVDTVKAPKELYAYVSSLSDKQLVAKITGTALNDMQIEYVHNTSNDGYSERMLNYKAHNELADDVINAIVGIYASNGCPMVLPLSGNEFNVRFLRPLNVASADKVIEDANTTALQVINLKDMVTFTDWRDAWTRPSDYFLYYGITKITVDGIEDGQRISRNSEVLTNQHNGGTNFQPLKNVNDQLDFIYHAGTTGVDGYLEYKNFSSTVTEFDVTIPVTVEYIWGKIYATAKVTVKRTASNAQHR